MYRARSIRNISIMNISKDHYKTLEIPLSATHKEIRHAYLTLAKKFHPDSPTGKENIFKEIGEAYEILGNKRTRVEYDSRRTREKGLKASSKETIRNDRNPRPADMQEHYRYDDPFSNSGYGMRYSYSKYKKDYHDLYFADKLPKNNERMNHYSSYTPGSSYPDSASPPQKQEKRQNEKAGYSYLIITACGFYILSLVWQATYPTPVSRYNNYKSTK